MGDILGLVTIGQSPRPDFEAAFRQFAPRAEIRLLGALDGLEREAIEELAASSQEYPLHTRLADGTTVDIPMSALAPLVADRARQLVQEGAALVVVLCAGGFPELDCPVPVLLPGKLMPAVAGALSRTRRVGVVTPIRGQVEVARKKWQGDGFELRVVYASPYRHDEIQSAAAELADPDLDLVILDCMGHDTDFQREFARYCGRPVLLAQTLTARVAGEFMNGWVGHA